MAGNMATQVLQTQTSSNKFGWDKTPAGSNKGCSDKSDSDDALCDKSGADKSDSDELDCDMVLCDNMPFPMESDWCLVDSEREPVEMGVDFSSLIVSCGTPNFFRTCT